MPFHVYFNWKGRFGDIAHKSQAGLGSGETSSLLRHHISTEINENFVSSRKSIYDYGS